MPATNGTDLIGLIADRSMNAAVRIAERHEVLKQLDAKLVCDALRVEIKAGYDEVVHDMKEALDVMGEQMAQATLNASCVLFAAKALRACGYIPETAS